MIIIGAGNLGRALANYVNFERRGFRIIGLFDNTDDATAIELINEPAANEIDLNGEFYSISGVKLQGVPTQKGIYIQNGKKVMIK